MPDVKLLWCLGDEPISVQRAAEMIGTTKQFAAKTVAKLQKAGLLQVATATGDRRALAISATRKGLDLVDVVTRERDAIEQEWRDKIGQVTLGQLTAGMAGLLR
ncbi:MarR family transcriptional regulator [Devosia oryziradicis]|uniref:MarR family transcriptional regulator n=1 Tax=Devosia oryziradicis TaxID=2801335 RepID=A0ABX7BWJ5_9HYPH|nr:MarR family transcriptional regulator [Devosia oryziradicis]QQR36319.1 MarR family transcriptional regulator [Devosia oryziradicis]